MINVKNIWKHSRLRFYILNALWNYKFWLYAKKIYKKVDFVVEEDEFNLEDDLKIRNKSKRMYRKRFVGYFFDNNIFLDNPGFKIKDRDVWLAWKKKKLIK
jgi:hypothetical protein